MRREPLGIAFHVSHVQHLFDYPIIQNGILIFIVKFSKNMAPHGKLFNHTLLWTVYPYHTVVVADYLTGVCTEVHATAD